MATVIIDQNQEYIWDVPDAILAKVIDHVMRRIDATSAFHDLLFASRNYGNLAFWQLGSEQKDLFAHHVNDYAETTELNEEEQKIIQKLKDMLEFSKNFDLESV